MFSQSSILNPQFSGFLIQSMSKYTTVGDDYNCHDVGDDLDCHDVADGVIVTSFLFVFTSDSSGSGSCYITVIII